MSQRRTNRIYRRRASTAAAVLVSVVGSLLATTPAAAAGVPNDNLLGAAGIEWPINASYVNTTGATVQPGEQSP